MNKNELAKIAGVASSSGEINYDELNQLIEESGLEKNKDEYSSEEGRQLQWYINHIEKGSKENQEKFNNEVASGKNRSDIIKEMQQEATKNEEEDDENSNKKKKKSTTSSLGKIKKQVREELDVELDLTTTAQLLKLAGLPEKDRYNEVETERFLKVCRLIYVEKKTTSEVAQQMGVNLKPTGVLEENSKQLEELTDLGALSLAQTLVETAEKREQQIANIIDRGVMTKFGQMVQNGQLKEQLIAAREKRLTQDSVTVEIEGWDQELLNGSNVHGNGNVKQITGSQEEKNKREEKENKQ